MSTGSPHPQAYGDTANDGCKQPTLSGILRDNYILQPDVQILVQNKMEKNYFLSADVQIYVQTRRKCQEPVAAMHLALNEMFPNLVLCCDFPKITITSVTCLATKPFDK